MTYFQCISCGDERSHFPQVYIMLNSKIFLEENDYRKQFDNKFENKFMDIAQEIAEKLSENGDNIDKDYVLRYHIDEVYGKYQDWLFRVQKHSFCSIECAIKFLEIEEIEFNKQ